MIQPHELADMRRAADKAPHDIQQKLHVLLDAYEDREELKTKVEEAEERKKLTDRAKSTLRKVYPSTISDRPTFEEPLSEDAWAECLADCDTPEERAAAVQEELIRAQAAEVQLLARVEALEEAIESALEELE